MSFIKRNYHLIFLFTLISVFGFLSYSLWRAYHPKAKISFLDIGQGDAIFIEAPNGNQMLIDGGPPTGALLRQLGEVMPFNDRFIDVVIATHPDQDHVGGLPELFDRYKVGVIFEPGSSADTGVYQELEKRIEEKGIKKILARRGMRINLGDGAVFDILFPIRDVSYLETNTSSIVGRFVYGSTTVMLTGDSPQVIENTLVVLDKKLPVSRLKSDILKAGHHGSRTSSGELFVRQVNPDIAILSVGKNNRYGHPNKEVVDRFNNLGIEMIRTDEEGTITFVSDGNELVRK